MMKRQYMLAMIHSFNQELLRMKSQGVNPAQIAQSGVVFAREIKNNLLRLGARPDTIVKFTPQLKGK